MKIRVLGCHGSDLQLENGSESRQCRTCAFLINERVLLDAGTVSSVLNLQEQFRIQDILLTHAHFDHIQSLPNIADNRVGENLESVRLWGLPETLDTIQTHLFNETIYPNFFRIPNANRPVLSSRSLQAEVLTDISQMSVTPIGVNHLVPALGFLIRDGESSAIFSGDTCQTEMLWEKASQAPTLKAAFIEASFPDEMSDLAEISKHLTPNLLYQEFQKIKKPDLQVYAYHLKPRFRSQIVQQLEKLPIPHLTILEEGQVIQVS